MICSPQNNLFFPTTHPRFCSTVGRLTQSNLPHFFSFFPHQNIRSTYYMIKETTHLEKKIQTKLYFWYSFGTKSPSKKTVQVQKLATIKDPQFLSNPQETWWKYLPHEVIIFSKFHEDRTKNVDLFINGQFLKVSHFVFLGL